MSNQVNETQTQTQDVTAKLVELMKENSVPVETLETILAMLGQEIHIDLNLKVGNLKIHLSAHTDTSSTTTTKGTQQQYRRETVLNCEQKKKKDDLFEQPVKSMRLQALTGLVN